MWYSASFGLVLPSAYLHTHKKRIIYSLNFLQSCHCLWISAGNVISGTVHCLRKITIQEKSPSKGNRGTGEFKHSLFKTAILLQCLCSRAHTTADTHTSISQLKQRLKVNPFRNHLASHLLWRGTAAVGTEGLQKKKQGSRICLCALVRVVVCYTLTLVDQVESSRAGLAFGGKADQDLVGGG